MKKFILLTVVMGLSACVSLSPVGSEHNNKNGVLTVYRSDELQGSATNTFIGWDGKYHLSLAPRQYTRVNVPAGMQTFKIRTHADLSNELTLYVNSAQNICLMAEVNPQNIAGINWFVSGYRLRQIECLSDHKQHEYTYIKTH